MEIAEFMENSDTIFFVPQPKFWEVLGKLPWRWKRYVDVGAGLGLLTKEMRARGFCVDAVDKYARKNALVPDIEIVDMVASKYGVNFNTNDCLIFARPCHGGFVSLVAMNYVDTGEVLYISKPENITSDLAGWSYEILAEGVGADGEVLCRLHGLEGAMLEFHRIMWGYKEDWWQKNEYRYVNDTGFGGFDADLIEDEDIKEKAFRANKGMLYREDDYDFTEDSGQTGWLAPDGTFYGVGYAAHDSAAYGRLASSVAVLERIGFIRLYGPGGRMLWDLGKRYGDKDPRLPTKEQVEVMKRLGYDLRKHGDFTAEEGDWS